MNSDHGIAVLRVLGSQTDQLWSVAHFSQIDHVIVCVSMYVKKETDLWEKEVKDSFVL